MKNKTTSIFKRIIEDKKVICAYIRGEKTIEDIKSRGIEFIKPI